MNIITISVKNLKRKKIRSVLTISGVTVAVAVLVSLLGFDRGYQKSLTDNIDKMGYQLLVTAKGCPYEAATMMLKGGGGLRYMQQKVYDGIRADSRVEEISPQLAASVFDPELQKGVGGYTLYMGIDDNYLKLKPWAKFKSGGWFSGSDANEVIIGYEAAEFEQRSVGDEVFIPGIGQILKVVGIFERTGTQDDGMLFVPIKSAQRIFSLPQKLTGIGIKLKDINQIAKFEEDLYSAPEIQVISMAQVRGTILNLVSSAKVLANSVAFIAIFIAVIGVMNTILMSVFERTREIGVMKAIGASAVDIFKLIWMETILVCTAGGILGSIFALLGSGIVEHMIKTILPYAPTGQLVLIKPGLLFAALLGAIALGIISGVYPAWRAASMRPVEAIRTGE